MLLCSEFPNDNESLHLGVSWGSEDLLGPVRPFGRRDVRHELAPPDPTVDVAFDGEPIVIEALEPFGSTEPLEVVGGELVAHRAGAAKVPEDTPQTLADVVAAMGAPAEAAFPDVPVARESDVFPLAIDATDADDTRQVRTTTSIPPPLGDPFEQLIARLADVALGAGDVFMAEALPRLLIEGEAPMDPGDAARRGLGDWVADGPSLRAPEAILAVSRAWRRILRGEGEDYSACGAATLDEWAASLLSLLLGLPERAAHFRRDLRDRGVAAYGLTCDAAA